MIKITYDSKSYKDIVKIKKNLLKWGYEEVETKQDYEGTNPHVTLTFRKKK